MTGETDNPRAERARDERAERAASADMAAEARDRAADYRDMTAGLRDRDSDLDRAIADELARHARDRLAAQRDRERAAEDRVRARGDRQAASASLEAAASEIARLTQRAVDTHEDAGAALEIARAQGLLMSRLALDAEQAMMELLQRAESAETSLVAAARAVLRHDRPRD